MEGERKEKPLLSLPFNRVSNGKQRKVSRARVRLFLKSDRSNTWLWEAGKSRAVGEEKKGEEGGA